MRRRADARGCEVELAGIGLSISDHFGERLCRQGQRRHDDRRRGADDRDRLQRFEVVGRVRLQRRIGDERGVRQQDRVAVRRRARHHVGAHHPAGTRTVLGHDRLPQSFAQPNREMAAGGVDDAAGHVRQDEVDGLTGIALRTRRRRQRRRADQRRQCKSIHAHSSSGMMPLAPRIARTPPPRRLRGGSVGKLSAADRSNISDMSHRIKHGCSAISENNGISAP